MTVGFLCSFFLILSQISLVLPETKTLTALINHTGIIHFNHCHCEISKTQWTRKVIYTDFWAMVGIFYVQFECFALVSEALFRQIRAKTQKYIFYFERGNIGLQTMSAAQP